MILDLVAVLACLIGYIVVSCVVYIYLLLSIYEEYDNSDSEEDIADWYAKEKDKELFGISTKAFFWPILFAYRLTKTLANKFNSK